MADTPVNPSSTVHGLGGSRDTDIEVPSGHQVFTTTKNLDAARAAYPNIDWFACYTVKDQNGNVANVQHTIHFNRPPAGTKLYYFDGKTAQPLKFGNGANKGNAQRSAATLSVGDPPVGAT